MEEHGCALRAEEVKNTGSSTEGYTDKEREREPASDVEVCQACAVYVPTLLFTSSWHALATTPMVHCSQLISSCLTSSPLPSNYLTLSHLVSHVRIHEYLSTSVAMWCTWPMLCFASESWCFVDLAAPLTLLFDRGELFRKSIWLEKKRILPKPSTVLLRETASHLRKLAKRKTTKALLSVQDLYTQRRSSPAKRTSWCGQVRKSRSAPKSQKTNHLQSIVYWTELLSRTYTYLYTSYLHNQSK